MSNNPHAGRYAPSPSGDLHKGSLLAALGSFLQARANAAPWYMRIDDLDTPRVVPGKSSAILHTLEAFGLCWDGPVFYQSQRSGAYAAALAQLRAHGRVFDCACTRREALTGAKGLEGRVYSGACRDGIAVEREARSVRARVEPTHIAMTDAVQGKYSQELAADVGDFVVRRADGITAYQLATVVDDAAQGVCEVVRGADLLSSTPRQIYLGRALGYTQPAYAHVPLLVDEQGRKLGKSNGALALDRKRRGAELAQALAWLGQMPPCGLAAEPIEQIIQWAVDHWRLQAVPRVSRVAVTDAVMP